MRANMGSPFEKVLASVEETCRATGLGRTTVYELLKSGALTSVKVGRRRLIRVDSIEALAQRAEG